MSTTNATWHDYTDRFDNRTEETCPSCGGTGKTVTYHPATKTTLAYWVTETCRRCNGSGTIKVRS